MKARLNDIADIRVGHTFRGKIPKDPDGQMAFLTISDIREIREGSVISPTGLDRIKYHPVNEDLILRHNDVLLPGRGEHYRAALYIEAESPSYAVIPSNLVFIIRVKQEQVLPRFLCWVFRQDKMVEYLKGQTRGSNIPFLPKSILNEVSIDIPALNIQEEIVALIELHEKQQQVLKSLSRNNEALIQGMVQKLVSGKKRQ